MRFLIDGYNLLFTLGLALGRTEPAALERARRRLLELLHAAHGEDSAGVTVVFDAAGRRRADPEPFPHGIHVHFATDHPTADDCIEELIRSHPAPPKLTVVSDDHRIQAVARRAGCVAWGCGDYLDWIDARRHPPAPADPLAPAKPDSVSGAETQRWLREFGDLADDPAFRELFDAFGTEDLLEGDPD